MKPTPYDDVNKILDLLQKGLVDILGKNLISIYLTGSLTYGGFDYGSSDIDLLIITNNSLSKKKLQEVKTMHANIGKKYPKWRKRIECSYITKEMFSRINPPRNRPYYNADKMYILSYGNEWIINLYALYKYGIALYGPEPKNFIKPIDINNVRAASKKNLYEEWQPKLKEQNPFEGDDYDSNHLQAYAILTMCRILYTAKNENFVSKKIASVWVKKMYGKSWNDLIEKAEAWKHGKELNAQKETLAFIKFTIDKVG